MSLKELELLEPQTPEEIVEEALTKHKKDKLYCLWSGGRDSTSTVHYIADNYPDYFGGTVFANTGIASPITRQFVLDYGKKNNWKVDMTWTLDKKLYPRKKRKRKIKIINTLFGIVKKQQQTKELYTFYDIVMEFGFPSAGSHRQVMGYLKFHGWYYFMQDKLLKGEKACFVSGVRKKESWVRSRKRFYTKTPIDENAGTIFVKPFLYKNGNQLQEYFITNNLKASPAYKWYDKSGECWCGCYYNEWELKMIEQNDPFLFDTIKWLESEVQRVGTKKAKKSPHWGGTVGAEDIKLQMDLDVNEDYCGESCEVN